MKSALILVVFLLVFSTSIISAIEPAEAVTATLRCYGGWQATATYTLTLDGEPISGPHTQSCPPTSKISNLPGSNDLTIHMPIIMTDPAGNVHVIDPTGNWENRPFGPTDGTVPDHPDCVGDCPSSYIFDIHGNFIIDPAAPTFLQPGEILFAIHNPGTSSPLTVRLYDIDSNTPISGATVTALNSTTNLPFTSGISDSSGTTILNLDNGGEYYLNVESSNHWPQSSDDFLIVNKHTWTMALTPGTSNAQQTIQDLQNQITDLKNQLVAAGNNGLWIGIGLIIGIIIGVVIAIVVTRRRTP